MRSYTVCIGNSDDRLSQAEWSQFIDDLALLLAELEVQIHFFGYSAPQGEWQSCCAVFEGDNDAPDFDAFLLAGLEQLRVNNRQDSIALIAGTTTFIEVTE